MKTQRPKGDWCPMTVWYDNSDFFVEGASRQGVMPTECFDDSMIRWSECIWYATWVTVKRSRRVPVLGNIRREHGKGTRRRTRSPLTQLKIGKKDISWLKGAWSWRKSILAQLKEPGKPGLHRLMQVRFRLGVSKIEECEIWRKEGGKNRSPDRLFLVLSSITEASRSVLHRFSHDSLQLRCT